MAQNFCADCGQPLNKKTEYAECNKCGRRYYLNPAPAVGVLPIKNGRVLLAYRGVNPHKGTIDAIGGFLNPGEHPEDGAKRETMEESGLKIKVGNLFGIYTDSYMDKYTKDSIPLLSIFYLTTIISGTPAPNDDVAKLEWFALDELPIDQAGFSSIQLVLQDLQKHFQR